MPPDITSNLLLSLHRWASSQDENFTTDAFAHVIRELVARDRASAARVLAKLAGLQGWMPMLLQGPGTSGVEITTQEPAERSIPDITIKAPNTLVYVEVKTESAVDVDQLERHRLALDASPEENKRLVLLTRMPAPIIELQGRVDVAVRWFEVAEWLESELDVTQHPQREVTAFLIEQFLDFLRARRMTMEQVSWQLVEGIRSLNSLMDMLAEAIEASRLKTKAALGGIGHNGHLFVMSNREFWIGVNYKEPDTVRFEAYEVDKALAERIGHGEVKTKNGVHQWRNRLSLVGESVHFFALSKPSQILCLEAFLRESLEMAEKAYP
jgi:hypothetical protein